MTMSSTRMLTDRELRAWRSFLRAHARVTRALEAELVAEHNLSLAEYDVLVNLTQAPDRRLRMTDLAARVLISRSGLTRLVDRMERAGMVERVSCPSDARGTFAALTDAGYQRLRSTAGTHLRGVREHVTGQFEGQELDRLFELMSRLAGPEPAEPARMGDGTGTGSRG
ncbi:MAG TPA: MarR family transcriptional regulator [Mycobacteriales bacterium]|nr:MarR family transcriptional regulator [Mycobacteriales bacterium]